MLCPPGAQTGVFAVETRCADYLATDIGVTWLSHKMKNAHYANDTLFHIIDTHSPEHSTLPALQKTSIHPLSDSIALLPSIHNVQVD